MFDHVAQRLLNDPVGHGLGVARQALARVEVELDGRRRIRPSPPGRWPATRSPGPVPDRRVRPGATRRSGREACASLSPRCASAVSAARRSAARSSRARPADRTMRTPLSPCRVSSCSSRAQRARACSAASRLRRRRTAADRTRGRDGGGGAGRDGHQQLLILVCEGVPVGAVDSGQHSQRLSPEDQRHEDRGAACRGQLLELAR